MFLILEIKNIPVHNSVTHLEILLITPSMLTYLKSYQKYVNILKFYYTNMFNNTKHIVVLTGI